MAEQKKQKLHHDEVSPAVFSPLPDLRLIRHKYAAEVEMHARTVYTAAKRLKEIYKAMSNEAIAIVGEDDVVRYVVTFDGHGSIEYQMEHYENAEYGPGIDDIVTKAEEMMNDAKDVADCAEPPKLPYESDVDE